MDRKFENGRFDAELSASLPEVEDPTVPRLCRSFRKLGKSLGIYDEENDTVLGIPVHQVVRPEGEVNWNIVSGLGQAFEGLPERFADAYKSIVEGVDHFGRKTEIAKEKAKRSPDAVLGAPPKEVKRGPGRYKV